MDLARFALVLAFVGLDDQDAAPDERVTLYPTAASLSADGRAWLVPVHFEVYEPEYDDPLRIALLEPLRRELGLATDGDTASRFRDRARLFLVDHERGEKRSVFVAGQRFELGPTEPNGHARATIELPLESLPTATGDAAAAAPRWLDLAIGAPGSAGHASVRVELIGPEGLSVISDLDDTLKITEVDDRSRALARTFLEEFEPVPGMPELCQRLAARGAAFHYVSLSPWQLAAPLRDFLARHAFPPGALELQHFRLQDGDFADLIGDSRAKKRAVLEPLLARWPKRRFVLIGDSSQSDAEVYAELARLHPEQIAAIWIRATPPSAAIDDAARAAAVAAIVADAARWDAAFKDVPSAKWKVFADPSELEVPE
jgi:hypothetical protein